MDSATKAAPEKSRSQKKREILALQKLGQQLADLPLEKLPVASLPQDLLEALHELKGMSKHGAVKRQTQRVGSLMRELSDTQIAAVEDYLKDPQKTMRIKGQMGNLWATRLCQGDAPLLQVFMDRLSPDNRKRLHELVRKAQKTVVDQPFESDPNFKKLLRFLKQKIPSDATP